ncbi:MAG: hypothetical protein JNK48_17990 [Bryobacterales bacterium]|nr:hypothetical protein [Bryobacterales bacterium]
MPPIAEHTTAASTATWRDRLRAFHLTAHGLDEHRQLPVPVSPPDPRLASAADLCGQALAAARSATRSAFLTHVAREKARLDDLLRTDDAHSADSVTSESVASSLGAEGNQFLDPAAMAKALRRPKRPKGLAPARRSLIEQAQTTLRDYLTAAHHGPAYYIIGDDTPDPFAAALDFDESLLARMSEVQRALRVAHLECDSHQDATLHSEQISRINWRSAQPEHLLAIPPVLAVDDATLASGPHISSLTRLIRSGRPVFALALTTGDDFAGFDFGYQALGFREVCVLQSSLDKWDHAAAALPAIALQPHPAVIFLDASAPPAAQAFYASRAFPHFFYNPAAGATWKDRFALLVPDPSTATAAHAALHLDAWRNHFRLIPQTGWEEEQLEFTEFLARYTAEPPLAIPYLAIPAADGAQHRIALTRDLADAAKDRSLAWRLLEELAGIRNAYVEAATTQLRAELSASSSNESAADIQSIRIETIQRLVAVLMSSQPLPAGTLTGLMLPPMPVLAPPPAAAPQPAQPAEQPAAAAPPEPEAEPSEDPYIDSFLCTSCNDCMKVNKLLFLYDGNKQAYIGDPKTGTFAELVKAAEGCPAKCIHPGKPRPGDSTATPEVLARAAKLR